MPTICVSIPAREQWPSEDEMLKRNAAIAELEANGIGECVESGGGGGGMEFCLDVPNLDRARAAVDAVLNAHFPGRLFNVNIEEQEDVVLTRLDREFYESLGAERADVPCRHAECTRGAVSMSVFCKKHHYEQARGRDCPFTD